MDKITEKSTPLEYWTKRFPDFMSKTSEWEKELLSSPEAFKHSVYSEQDLRHLLDLLKDFDVKKKQGKFVESKIYKRFYKELDYGHEANLIKNGFAQAGATALIAFGASRMDEGAYLLSNIIFIVVGIVLAIVGRIFWGINKTHDRMIDKFYKRFDYLDSPKEKSKTTVGERCLLRILIFIPLCSLVAMVTGLLVEEIENTQAGLWVAGAGVLVVLIDLVVMICLSRD